MKIGKLVCGVGVNDADYVIQEVETIGYVNGKRRQTLVWFCPFYRSWSDMIKRCYYTKYHDKFPTYIGCTVSKEWLTFSNFKSWMKAQDFVDNQLDKDLLFEGDKVYSADTCVFVSKVVNSFITDSAASRGEWLIGVCWDKSASKFMSQCRNPFTKKNEYLGYFTCELEAHKAWKVRKLELAKELAEIQTDERVAEALINRYSNYK